MRTKVLSVTIFFSLFIISCELTQQNEYYHLDSSYRSLLKTGDTLVYMDCDSKTDTFLVFRKISGTDRTSLSGSNCQIDPSAYFDIELVYLQRKKEKMWEPNCLSPAEVTDFGDCGAEYDCDQTIFIMVSAGVTDKKRQLRTNTKPFILWYGNPIRLDSDINSMTVLDNTYDNVFFYKSDNIQKTDSIQGIYYSYKYGIIQMNLANGNELKLVRK
jgi:hypothetical protein